MSYAELIATTSLDVLYTRSVEESDFELFKWLIENRPQRPTIALTKEMHRRALAEHLALTETYLRTVQFIKPPGSETSTEMTYHDFITITATVKTDVPVDRIVRYINWLVGMNFSSLDNDELDALLTRLILEVETVEEVSLNAVRTLLLAISMTTAWSRDSIIELCKPDNNWKPLMDVLGETGMLSSDVFLDLSTHLSEEMRSYLWKSSYFKEPASLSDKAARIAGSMLPDLDMDMYQSIVEMLNSLGGLDKYGQVILDCLIGNSPSDGRGVQQIITSSFMQCDEPGPFSLICVYMLRKASVDLFDAFFEVVETADDWRLPILIQSLNILLSLQVCHSSCEDENCLCDPLNIMQCRRFVRLLGCYRRHLDLFIPKLAQIACKPEFEPLIDIIIEEVWRRLDFSSEKDKNGLLLVADELLALSALDDSRELIENNSWLVGPLTIADMLISFRSSSKIIQDYLSAHPVEHIKMIFSKFKKHERVLRRLIRLLPMPRQVRITGSKLIVGSRTYVRHETRTLFYLSDTPTKKCSACDNSLNEHAVFVDLRERYDVYFCASCAEKRDDPTKVEPASCSVCMDSEDLKMNFLTCNHVMCSDCIGGVMKNAAYCPICRAAIQPIGQTLITEDEAVEFFMHEHAA